MANDVMPPRDRGLAFIMLGALVLVMAIAGVVVALLLEDLTLSRLITCLCALGFGSAFLFFGTRIRRAG